MTQPTTNSTLGRLFRWFLSTALGRKLFAKVFGNFGN